MSVHIEGDVDVSRVEPQRCLWGAFLRGNAYGTTDWPQSATSTAYDQFVAQVGRPPSATHIGLSWVGGNGKPGTWANVRAGADRAVATGARLLVTWGPQKSGGGVNQPNFTSRKIVDLDGSQMLPGMTFGMYVDQFAADTLAWGKPFLLRFAWEMNGTWYPWSDGRNTNEPGDYIAMWNAVKARFEKTNPYATWVWCPNAGGAVTIESVFPGDNAIDWAGVDGYVQQPAGWQTFRELFQDPVQRIRALTGKPLAIVETGVVNGTDYEKADWLTDAYEDEIFDDDFQISMVNWFDDASYPNTANATHLANASPEGSAFAALRGALTDERYVGPEFVDAPLEKVAGP